MPDWKTLIRQSLPALADDPVREADILEELAQHLAERYREALSAGATEADAQQAAVAELAERDRAGREIRAAERLRATRLRIDEPPARPWLASLQDVRFALRLLRRSPGFALTAIATLALGIGGTTAIFTIVNAALLRPLPYRSPDRLVAVGEASPDEAGPVGFATVRDWARRSRTFDAMSMIGLWTPTLLAGSEPERLSGLKVSWNYFRMLGVRPALGRDFREDEDRPNQWRVVLLSDGLWRRRFGADPAIVGRSVTMNDRRYLVAGVMPAGFEPLISGHYYQPSEIWAPLGYDESLPYACRTCQHLRVIGRLSPGVSVTEAGADINTVQAALRAEHPTEYGPAAMAVAPLADVIAGSTPRQLALLTGAVVLVLLVACANVANLLLARASGRARELAVRSALGAGRNRLVRQLLTESLVLAAAGAGVGLLIARAGIAALEGLPGVSIPRLAQAGLDARVLAFAVGLTLVTAVLFGLVPARRATRLDAQSALANEGRSAVGAGSRGIRQAIAIAEIALAFTLLTGSGLMLRSVGRLLAVDPGFDPSRVVSAKLEFGGAAYATDEGVLAASHAVLDRVRALPGVESAALASQIPLGGNGDRYGFHIEGRVPANPEEDPSLERYGVTPDYFRVMRIPLRRGRVLQREDTAGSLPVLLINETAARTLWPGQDPIGRRVRVGDAASGPWRTVVGVVGDVRHRDLSRAPDMQMYVPESQFTDSSLVLVVRGAGDLAGLAPALRAAVAQAARGVPVYGAAALDDVVRLSLGSRRLVMLVLVLFSAAGLTLAAIGVYGVTAWIVSEQTKEIGLRLALGADSRHIAGMVMRGGLVVVGSGLAIGLAGSIAVTRSLKSFLFAVSATDPPTFVLAAFVLAAVGLAGHWLPARRATRLDPVTALRQG